MLGAPCVAENRTPAANNLLQLDGDRVAARRWKLNISQSQLGQRLGCNASRVCHLENTQPHRVTQQTLTKLAVALDCPPADLLHR